MHHVTENQIPGSSPSSEVDVLRSLLVSPEMEAVGELQDLLETLRKQLKDPEHLISLLLPVITEVLRRKVAESGTAIAHAIAPIIDKAIQEKALQDSESVAAVIGPIILEALTKEIRISPEEVVSALAPVSARAIARHHTTSPHEVARDLAPIIGGAIKEQIRSERDTIVDALYPVIGSTIAKYMSQTLSNLVQTINAKIEQSFSMRGLMRKVRSRYRGVQEAELLLMESMPFKVDAVFLIHKGSGLVIAQSQNPTSQLLDSDLLSGMLTAIRGLLNESIARSGKVSELDQIEYGQSKIVLEVAGYCYLAAVVEGVPNQEFVNTMRTTLSAIVADADAAIQHYNGDTSSIPPTVHEKIRALCTQQFATPSARRAKPHLFFIATGILILLVLGLLGIGMYRDKQDRDLQARISAELSGAFPGDQINVSVQRDRLELRGVVVNPYLRSQAELLARASAPEATIQNTLTLGEQPPLPALTESQVRDITSILNGVDGVSCISEFREGDLVLGGTVEEARLLTQVQRAFARVAGIRSITNNIRVSQAVLENRIYLDIGSSLLKPSERPKLTLLKQWLDRHTDVRLRILGHNDQTGPDIVNRQLARSRAARIRDMLITMGISADRLVASGGSDRVPDTAPEQGGWAQRCVLFEIIEDFGESKK